MSFCAELSISSRKVAEIAGVQRYGLTQHKNAQQYITQHKTIHSRILHSVLASSYVAVSMVCCLHTILPLHLGLLPV